MKVKFNLFERVAGLFVLSALVAGVGTTIGIGIKKGWFDKKMTLKTYVPTADGIHSGTSVQLAGLQIGSVDEVDLKMGQKVEIRFKVSKRFLHQIRSDSKVRILRPFIIGERVLEITPGHEKARRVREGQTLIAEYTPDFLELLGGHKLGQYFESLNKTMNNMQKLAEAFFSDERSETIIQLFDEMMPLMARMNTMATEVSSLSAQLNKEQKMGRAVDELLYMSKQMKGSLPAVSKDLPQLSKNVLELTENLNKLTNDMNEIIPIMKQIAPEFPETSRKAVQALDETVLTLKAMQKTWFLRSNVKDVKKEMIKNRQPSSGN